MRRLVLWFVVVVVFLMSKFCLNVEEYWGIFWNLEFGEFDDVFLVLQMVVKGDIDFWGLLEVSG